MINPPKRHRPEESEKTTSKFEVPAFIGITAIGAFVTSLLYVDGLSRYLQYDLKPYLNVQDYVQITSFWALNAIQFVILLVVFFLFWTAALAHNPKTRHLS
jgi:hypothetical protein